MAEAKNLVKSCPKLVVTPRHIAGAKENFSK